MLFIHEDIQSIYIRESHVYNNVVYHSISMRQKVKNVTLFSSSSFLQSSKEMQYTLFSYKNNFIRTKALVLVKKLRTS